MKADHSLTLRPRILRDLYANRLQQVADLPCTEAAGEVKMGTRQDQLGCGDDWGPVLKLSHCLISSV